MGLQLPPSVALLLTVAFIVFLFRRDIREKPEVSSALWLPLIWLVLMCSRPVSAWLNIFGFHVAGAASVEEGSPVDAAALFALIAAGFYILNKRQVNFSEIIQNNGWLIAFLVYCFISITWSDYPFISLKRWIKGLGPPIMALIVLTEPNFEEALTTLMKRCAYIVVPVSILFIKYFPQLGQYYDEWTGFAMTQGIATHKNLLGVDCMILGFFFFWYLMQIWRTERSRWRTHELWLVVGFLLIIGWLLRRAHSATALGCLLIGVIVIILARTRSINKRLIGIYVLIAGSFVVVVELAFGISGQIGEALGRGSTLSGRKVLWEHLLALHTNPILGTGFESFWMGKRLEKLEGIFFFIPNEAHNGYLEIYLNLGLLGLGIVIALIVATYRKILADLFRDHAWARYRFGWLAVVVLYNWTEAGARSLNPVWFVFYLIAMEYPRKYLETPNASLRMARLKGEDYVYAERESWFGPHSNDR